MFKFFSKTLLKIMKISQYKGYITTGRFQQVEQVNTQQKMIFVNHNACNENNSAIKIQASFLFSGVFFFSTNSTNSIAHYNKESRLSAFKKMGLIQVLREQKATGLLMHLGLGVGGWGGEGSIRWEKQGNAGVCRFGPRKRSSLRPSDLPSRQRSRCFRVFLIRIFLSNNQTRTKRAQTFRKHKNNVSF